MIIQVCSVVSRQGHLMWNATFRRLTASLLQAMGSTGCHPKERQKQIFKKLLLEQKAASKLNSTPKVDQTNWVINLSSRTLSDAETTLLKKGLNFAVTPTNIRTTEIIAKVETTIRPLDTEQADTVRRTVNNVLQKAVPPKPNITAEMRNALKSLKQDHSIMILPADKGCAIVVLDTEAATTPRCQWWRRVAVQRPYRRNSTGRVTWTQQRSEPTRPHSAHTYPDCRPSKFRSEIHIL